MIYNNQKNIFFFWDGGKMSFMRYMTLYSFRLFHPEWNIILIKDNTKYKNYLWKHTEKQDLLSYDGEDYFQKSLELDLKIVNFSEKYAQIFKDIEIDINSISPVHKKDILNWYLLYENCGIVADMDILFIRNLNKEYRLFIENESQIGLICFDDLPLAKYIPVSLMMGNKSNFSFSIFKKSLNKYNPDVYESCGSVLLDDSLPGLINNPSELEYFKLHDEIIFPFTTKISYTEAVYNQYFGDLKHLVDIKKTAGIHWYAGNPHSQFFNNQINHKNYHNFNGTLAKFIKEIYNA